MHLFITSAQEEDGIGPVVTHVGPDSDQVGPQVPQGGPADGNNSLFIALSGHNCRRILEVHIGDLESKQLIDPNSCRVEQFHHGPIAVTASGIGRDAGN